MRPKSYDAVHPGRRRWLTCAVLSLAGLVTIGSSSAFTPGVHFKITVENDTKYVITSTVNSGHEPRMISPGHSTTYDGNYNTFTLMVTGHPLNPTSRSLAGRLVATYKIVQSGSTLQIKGPY
jgi:hypothetical protein